MEARTPAGVVKAEQLGGMELRLQTGTASGCVVLLDARTVTVERHGALRSTLERLDLEDVASVQLEYGLRCRLVADTRDGERVVLVTGGRPRELAWLRDVLDEAAFRRRRSLGAVGIPTVPPALERLRDHGPEEG